MGKSKLSELISLIEANVLDAEQGLPDEVFYFVGRMIPYVNVDLIIRDPLHGVLLTWRDDKYCGKGWHFPGGILRIRERWVDRVRKVARNELDLELSRIIGPLDINEIIANDRLDRSHFVSLSFMCELAVDQMNSLSDAILKNPDQINFFREKPKDLIVWHEIYDKYFISGA
jgi:ADP-ribose pyrophosphatase YjhB (NUDIX family)